MNFRKIFKGGGGGVIFKGFKADFWEQNLKFDFPKMRGVCQRRFGIFTKIHPFWHHHPSLRSRADPPTPPHTLLKSFEPTALFKNIKIQTICFCYHNHAMVCTDLPSHYCIIYKACGLVHGLFCACDECSVQAGSTDW